MKRQLEDLLHAFWSRKGWLNQSLRPLSQIYWQIAKYRAKQQQQRAWHAPVVVIVVGNIIVGGSGKTPVTAAICTYLQAHGLHPGIVSRGYGVKITGQPHLSSAAVSSTYLGDEPALLHQQTHAPVACHPQRALAAQALLAAHPEVDVIIADDGLQHLALARDIEIVVQDQRGSANGLLLPAGPLREPPARLAQADWVINNYSAATQPPPAANHVRMQLSPSSVLELASGTSHSWQDWYAHNKHQSFDAAAGIGQPQRFFQMLRDCGLKLHQTTPIADHQVIPTKLMQSLAERPLLVTAKDAIKFKDKTFANVLAINAEPIFTPANWLADLLAKITSLGSGCQQQTKAQDI